VLAIAPAGDGDPWPVAPWPSTGVRVRRLALVDDEIALALPPESVMLARLTVSPEERP
jgi:hypothetical protein